MFSASLMTFMRCAISCFYVESTISLVNFFLNAYILCHMGIIQQIIPRKAYTDSESIIQQYIPL